MRTLRYYDRQGLLSPSHYSEAGYRLYTDADLIRLQYILALKFLGFSLDEIRVCVQNGPGRLQDVLAQQKAMLMAKRVHLDAIITAIGHTEKLLAGGAGDADLIAKVIGVMQMEQKSGWIAKYLTPEQRETMKELARKSYSPEALQKLATRGSLEDRIRFQEEYQVLLADLRRLATEGADPAGPAAQAVARRMAETVQSLSQGDPNVQAGMKKAWENFNALPAAERPPAYRLNESERAFIKQAMGIMYGQRR
jgi:DNA-binding transcriptional MerR regulator